LVHGYEPASNGEQANGIFNVDAKFDYLKNEVNDMKQFMIAILVGALVFGFTAAATAVTPTSTATPTQTSADTSKKASEKTTIYLDGLSGDYHMTEDYGTDSNKTSTNKVDAKLSGIILGLESPVTNRFKFGLEYGQGSMNDIKSTGNWDQWALKKCDFTLFEAKGGYRVVNCDSFKLDMIMSILAINSKIQYNGQYGAAATGRNNIGGNMIGADLVCNFTDKASLQCTIASSLLGAYVNNYIDNPGEDEAAINEYKLKFNYFLTDHWALTLGYCDYQFTSKTNFPTEDPPKVKKMDGNLSGATLGVKFRF
jgi:opacity protein-like surface antigen